MNQYAKLESAIALPAMLIYTIYKYSDEYHESYVVQEWHIQPDQKPQPGNGYAFKSLDLARHLASSGGRARVEPDPDDDPRTVESWL